MSGTTQPDLFSKNRPVSLSEGYIAPDGSYVPPVAIPTTSVDRQLSFIKPIPPPEVNAGDFPTPPVKTQPQQQPQQITPIGQQSFKSQFDSLFKPNLLNTYWQPNYHFRLFMAGDRDVLKKLGDPQEISQVYAALSTQGTIAQVVIAETGVTGFNIKDVEVNTVLAQNSATKEQAVTDVKMTVVEPMGLSFLDGLFGAAAYLGIFDYTKAFYFLELTFTGYNPDGSYAGRPLKTGYPNGGRWLWMLSPTIIETKINEGGGSYNLQFVIAETAPAILDNSLLQIPEGMKAEGKTVGELFKDLENKLNDKWKDKYGQQNGKGLVTFKIVTRPISAGPNQGKDPKDFKLVAQKPEESSTRHIQMDGNSNGAVTITAAVGVSVNEFISSALKAGEDGQAVIKDEVTTTKTDQSATQTNSRGVRESTYFSIEPDIAYVAADLNSGNYIKEVTIYVVSHYSQRGLLSQTQIQDTRQAYSQRHAILALGKYGFLQKRYDYIFTGQNTEVLDFNINFNMTWQAILPKFAGIRMGYLNEANHAKLNPGTASPQGDAIQTDNDLRLQIAKEIRDAQVAVDTAQANLQSPDSGNVAVTQAAQAQQRLTVAQQRQAALPEASAAKGTIFIEDLLNKLNQKKPVPLPISFWQGYYDTEREAGTGVNGQWHRDRSVVGAIAAQIQNDTITGAFQQINMTIRGDPYWLGQGNLERMVTLRSGKPTLDPANLPDWSSGNPAFFMNFKYPLQVGDDFRPVLKESEVFNGLYEVVQVKNMFAEGAFKQELRALRMPLLDINLAMTDDSQIPASNSAQGSSPNGGSGNGANPPAQGTTPGNIPVTPTPPAAITPLQQQDSFTVGNLTQQQTAQLKANIGDPESGNNPSTGNNGKGYWGQYQVGAGILYDQGYITDPKGDLADQSIWTGKNGMTSVGAFLNSPAEQNAVMDQNLTNNYKTLVRNGTITDSTPPDRVAGLLAVSHLGGAGAATSLARGGGSRTDAFGTSTSTYYSRGASAVLASR